jgi:hypothetical protein
MSPTPNDESGSSTKAPKHPFNQDRNVPRSMTTANCIDASDEYPASFEHFDAHWAEGGPGKMYSCRPRWVPIDPYKAPAP